MAVWPAMETCPDFLAGSLNALIIDTAVGWP